VAEVHLQSGAMVKMMRPTPARAVGVALKVLFAPALVLLLYSCRRANHVADTLYPAGTLEAMERLEAQIRDMQRELTCYRATTDAQLHAACRPGQPELQESVQQVDPQIRQLERQRDEICLACKSGSPKDGGDEVDTSSGCKFHCSKIGYCGHSNTYQRGGTDCTPGASVAPSSDALAEMRVLKAATLTGSLIPVDESSLLPGVTLVLHGDLSRVEAMLQSAERWGGNVSIAVLVRSAGELALTERALQNASGVRWCAYKPPMLNPDDIRDGRNRDEMCRTCKESPAGGCKLYCSLHGFCGGEEDYKKGGMDCRPGAPAPAPDLSDPRVLADWVYPINIMRNRALQLVRGIPACSIHVHACMGCVRYMYAARHA
jgi:hypothetical protein